MQGSVRFCFKDGLGFRVGLGFWVPWRTVCWFCYWRTIFPWFPWSSFRLSVVTDSLLLTFCFPQRSWIFLQGVTDSLLLTFCFPPGSLILLPASGGWLTLCYWLFVSHSWSLCVLCWCAAVTDFVLWGSWLGRLGWLTRVTDSVFVPVFHVKILPWVIAVLSWFWRATDMYTKQGDIWGQLGTLGGASWKLIQWVGKIWNAGSYFTNV